jgi:hypothetical protein
MSIKREQKTGINLMTKTMADTKKGVWCVITGGAYLNCFFPKNSTFNEL